MKKLGFIALALVTILTTLGVGYAMWFQTINISGTVNTGHVTLQVSNYTGTWGYKDIDADAEGENNFNFVQGAGTVNNPALPADWADDPGSDHALIGYAAVLSVNQAEPATVDCTAGAINIVLAYSNLFPASNSADNPNPGDRPWCADFDVKNTGSIPIKFTLTPATLTPTATNMPTISVSYSGAAGAITSLEGYQLEPGQTVHVMICVNVLESTVQNYTGSFNLTIWGVQWNEYGEAIPS